MTFKPKRGDIVEVSDDGINWQPKPRIFLTEIEGAEYPFICVDSNLENEFKNGGKFRYTPWKYMREVGTKTTLTKSQIAEKLNIPVEELEIID